MTNAQWPLGIVIGRIGHWDLVIRHSSETPMYPLIPTQAFAGSVELVSYFFTVVAALVGLLLAMRS